MCTSKSAGTLCSMMSRNCRNSAGIQVAPGMSCRVQCPFLYRGQRTETYRAVPLVVMSTPFRLSGTQRQEWGGPFPTLESDFFHPRTAPAPGLVDLHVRTHDVAHFVDKKRLFGQLESLAAMWLELKSSPDPATPFGSVPLPAPWSV